MANELASTVDDFVAHASTKRLGAQDTRSALSNALDAADRTMRPLGY
jgi:hypothetical protein